MEFVGFDEAVRFTGRGGEAVTIEAGLYRVEAAGDGHVALVGDDGRATLVEAAAGGHPLALEAPFAVAFDAAKGDRRLALLLPGGRALVAGGAPGEGVGQQLFGPPGFASAILQYDVPTHMIHRTDLWVTMHKFGFGTIEPGTSPTPFAPQTFPPNWVSTTVVTCYAPPAGSYGPGGPGTASGEPPFPPGSIVRRGPYPGYIVSTTPVRVTVWGSVAGKAVELRVTSHVAAVTLGVSTILSMTWMDVYRIVPAADGPVDFPGVIVATGRVPTGPPPPGKTWAAMAQGMLTSSTGYGAPVVFDLYVKGILVQTRQMGYYASYPGGPPPVLADK